MNKTVRRVGALSAAAALLSGCANANDSEWGRIAMPAPATAEGPRILLLWQGSWIAAMTVAVFVWGLLLWAIVR